MSAPLLTALKQFLSAVEHVQRQLRALLATKLDALVTVNSAELLRLAEEEQQLALQLQKLVGLRSRLLEHGRQQGWQATTLLELAAYLGGDQRAELETRITRAEETAAELRQESWVHWIVSQRCYNHYTELLELVAHGGEQSPTYGNGTPQRACGGAVLDAAC